MRISDWSSDVCSSDLMERTWTRGREPGGRESRRRSNDVLLELGRKTNESTAIHHLVGADDEGEASDGDDEDEGEGGAGAVDAQGRHEIGRASRREGGWQKVVNEGVGGGAKKTK